MAAAGLAATARAQTPAASAAAGKGRIKQALMRFNFGRDSKLSFDDMCREAARLGFHGFDLVGPQDWPTLKKYGLVCTMGPAMGVTIRDGLIRPELHDAIEKAMHGEIDQCAANGWPNFITVGGERRGLGYEEGKDRAATLLNRVKAHAEDKGVTICIEVVNSKYTDPEFGRADAIFDHLAWGVDLCKRVNSPRVKVLFDIYHVQIMDGDVCANIREHFPGSRTFTRRASRAGVSSTTRRKSIIDSWRRRLPISGSPGTWRTNGGRPPAGIRIESLRRVFEIMDV